MKLHPIIDMAAQVRFEFIELSTNTRFKNGMKVVLVH